MLFPTWLAYMTEANGVSFGVTNWINLVREVAKTGLQFRLVLAQDDLARRSIADVGTTVHTLVVDRDAEGRTTQ